jgi:hypothetical protein
MEQNEKETVVIMEEHYCDTDEIYEDWFRCSKCDKDWLVQYYKFCPFCGVALIWQLEH